MLRNLPLIFCVLLSQICHAGVNNTVYVDAKPGHYATQEGSLTIRAAGGRERSFELVSVNHWSGHICELDGTIREEKAELVSGFGKQCIVQFHVNREEIDVLGKGTACEMEFCGAGASFDGTYIAVDSRCEDAAIVSAQNEFQRAYDAKDYIKALDILKPLLARCESVSDEWHIDRVRNDLAITQYHAGDTVGCKKTLEPLREYAAKTDEQLNAEESDFTLAKILPIAHAARTNLKLCGG